MTVTYGFYDSLNGDRKYNAAQMSRLFQGIISDGIMSSIGSGFAVTAAGGSMVVNVGIGRAWFKGTWTYNDAVLPLTLDGSDGVLNRIDTVVIEVNIDTSVRANTIKIVKGTPASSPSAPTLTNNTTIGQYPLADIYVGAGVTTISQANITSRIGTTACPLASALIPPFDFSLLEQQYIAQFNTWFTNLQNQLDSNQAANLQNQINVNDAADKSGWIGLSASMTYASVDGATGFANFNADLSGVLSRGMRLKYTQDQALTAYWNLDSNSNSQVGSFNGTDTNVSYSSGKFGNAATFNGVSSKIVIADNVAFKPTIEFTLGCWFKSQGNGPQRIFQSYSANSALAGIDLRINATNNLACLLGANTGGGSGNSTDVVYTGATLNDNTWHQVVVTFRNNYLQLYLDGILVASDYALTPAYAATNYVRIGCGNTSGSDYAFFNGQIDDLFFINGYALDEQTIRTKYYANSAQGTAPITIQKKAIVTRVGQYLAGNTQVVFWGGNDFSLTSGSITNPCYSTMKNPFGFNSDPKKWRIYVSDPVIRTKTSPVNGTWYYTDMGSRNIAVPIGAWNLKFVTEVYATVTGLSVVIVSVALSRSSTTPTDPELRCRMLGTGHAATEPYVGQNTFGESRVNLNSKTTFYLIYRHESNNIGSLASDGSSGNPTMLIAECAYL